MISGRISQTDGRTASPLVQPEGLIRLDQPATNRNVRLLVGLIIPYCNYHGAEPQHSADESQPFRSAAMRVSAAAGSHR